MFAPLNIIWKEDCNTMNTKLYAIKAKKIDIQKNSSSGGAFVILSDYVFSCGGVVACSVYDYSKHTLKFKIIHNTEERYHAIGSKYVQSNIGNIYQECYQWIRDNPGKKLMFVGMGCQAAAFQTFSQEKGIRDSVIIVDIICHGVPSPQMWKDYAQYIENRYHGTISYLTFKDKRNGWNRPTAVVKVNGNEILLRDYVRVFNSGMALRPSCHCCPYTCITRTVDITIGDYWGIEKSHPEFMSELGVSILMTHSRLGEYVFENVKTKVDWIETNKKDCKQSQLHYPTKKSDNREQFWKEYKANGIKYVMHKYGDLSVTEKLRYKIRTLKKMFKR